MIYNKTVFRGSYSIYEYLTTKRRLPLTDWLTDWLSKFVPSGIERQSMRSVAIERIARVLTWGLAKSKRVARAESKHVERTSSRRDRTSAASVGASCFLNLLSYKYSNEIFFVTTVKISPPINGGRRSPGNGASKTEACLGVQVTQFRAGAPGWQGLIRGPAKVGSGWGTLTNAPPTPNDDAENWNKRNLIKKKKMTV